MGDNHRGSHTVCWLPPPRWPSPKELLPIWVFPYPNLDEALTALWQHQFIKILCLFHWLFSLLPIMSYLSWESPQPPVCKEGLWVAAAGAVRLICCPNNCPLSPHHCVCVLYILFPNSFILLTCQAVQSEAAGGEYLHKYWTKTGRNSRTATGLILDKYFTRPTNTPGGGGGGVWGVWRMRRILENTQRGGGQAVVLVSQLQVDI